MENPLLNPEAIFFDYGNTLAADTEDKFTDINTWAVSKGLPALDAEAFDRAWGASETWSSAYRAVNGKRTWKKDRYWLNFCREYLVEAYGEDAGDLAEEMHHTQFFTNTLYDDTISTLKELRARGIRLGVISNWDAPTLLANFDRFGMTPYFESILPSWYVEANKPHSHFFLSAMQALGVHPSKSMHIGDSWGCDVIGARGVGITPVWINEHNGPVPDGSDVLQIRRLGELLSLVK
jgi:putative hydrolase of the HAD superfamily